MNKLQAFRKLCEAFFRYLVFTLMPCCSENLVTKGSIWHVALAAFPVGLNIHGPTFAKFMVDIGSHGDSAVVELIIHIGSGPRYRTNTAFERRCE